MGISSTTFETIVNESYFDSDLAALLRLSYQTLALEEALSGSCLNLPAARLLLVRSIYKRLLNGIVSPAGFTALYPLVASSLPSRLPSGTTELLVQTALEIELGIRNSTGDLLNGSATPTQTPYGCVGVVLEAVDLNSGALKYRLRTEYESTLDPSLSVFLDQSGSLFFVFCIFWVFYNPISSLMMW